MNDNEINKFNLAVEQNHELDKSEEVTEVKLPFWKKDTPALRLVVRSVLLIIGVLVIYIKIFGWPLDKIDAREYLPDKNMKVVMQNYLIHEDRVTKIPNIHTTTVYAKENPNFVHFENISLMGDDKRGKVKLESGGYLEYDSKLNAVITTSIYNNTFGTSLNNSQILFSCNLGKSIASGDQNTDLYIDKSLHTVTTAAGVFKDCLLLKKTISFKEGELHTNVYYAKGIGEIKSVTKNGDKVISEREIQSYEYF